MEPWQSKATAPTVSCDLSPSWTPVLESAVGEDETGGFSDKAVATAPMEFTLPLFPEVGPVSSADGELAGLAVELDAPTAVAGAFLNALLTVSP